MKTNENPDDDYQKRIEDYGPEAEKEIEDLAAKGKDTYQEKVEDVAAASKEKVEDVAAASKEAYEEKVADLSEEDEAVMFDNGPDAPEERHSNGAVKGVAWLLGIVAIFAIAILLTWLIGGRTPVNDRSADRQTYAYSQKVDTLKIEPGTTAEKVTAKYVAVLNPSKDSKAKYAPKDGGKDKGFVSKGKGKAYKGGKHGAKGSAYDDRIEREAREVIHGDYGVNPGRKAKLGGDYKAVQARVNQILHK